MAGHNAQHAVELASSVRATLEKSPARVYFKNLEAPAALKEGKGLLLRRRAPDALPLLERAVQLGADVYDVDRSPAFADSEIALGMCLASLGRYGEAKSHLAKAKAIHATHRELGEHFRKPLRELEMLVAVR